MDYFWFLKTLKPFSSAFDVIGVGAQSTLGGHDIFARKNMYEKLSKCPSFA